MRRERSLLVFIYPPAKQLPLPPPLPHEIHEFLQFKDLYLRIYIYLSYILWDPRLFCRLGGGVGVGAGNVRAGSAVMGAGIKRKFGLIPKKSDAFNSRLPERSRSRVPAAFPAPQPPRALRGFGLEMINFCRGN